MRRELYKRWRNHPLREILRRAQNGDHIYADELDDLRLPPKVRKATEKAIAECKKPDAHRRGGIGGIADELSSVLVDSLPEHHETTDDFLRRRRSMGDPDAAATLKAQRQAEDDLAAEIHRNAQVRGPSDPRSGAFGNIGDAPEEATTT